jgi:nicotinate-nucleotide pyrophosphorylase (carboxylating)
MTNNSYFEPIIIDENLRHLIKSALEEDIQSGDVTTDATIAKHTKAHATVTAKQTGVVCGLPVFTEVFALLDPKISVQTNVTERSSVEPATVVIEMDGPLSSMLKGERVALNFLGMMSGIATKTSEFVQAVSHTSCKIIDTRKTIPLMRTLQKYAVRAGGGVNHRTGLYDMVLIKDNHIDGCGGITNAVKQAQKMWQGKLKTETETRNLDEVKEALEAGADRIMLDNMDYEIMKKAVQLINKKAESEASGGITLDTVGKTAETGVDFISVGALTHSFNCMDYSMLITAYQN